MLKRWKTRISAAFCALLTLLPLSGCDTAQSNTPTVTGALTITALDVGKADAMILQTANATVVLDTGCKGDGKLIEERLAEQNITKIDALIITHFDKDHVGGAARLVNRMEIDNIYLPDYAGVNDEYKDFQKKLEKSDTAPTILAAGETQKWQYDDVAFTLTAAQKTDYGKNEENDFSLGLYLRHGDKSFLFAGDAEEARQQELMQSNFGKVDFLKFPYHGNYLKTTEAFLDAFAPHYALICCSKKEYAQDGTVNTLQKRGIETYYTCDGDITVISDGRTILVNQAKTAE